MIDKGKKLFTRAFLVDLSDKFAIEGRLLGKRISFHSSDECVLTIVIPAVIQKGDLFVVGIPDAISKYGIDLNEWGRWSRYRCVDDAKIFDANVSSVVVECFVNEKCTVPAAAEIQSKASEFIHALQIIKPEAIRVCSDKSSANLCDISAEVFIGDDGKPQSAILAAISFDYNEDKLTSTDIKRAIRNFNKSVSLPYEMLDNARVNLSRNDTRSAVLHCATAIEIAMKNLIIAYLDTTVTDDQLKDYVLRQADGYSKLVKLCKKISISLEGLPNVKETVVDIRNRVVHGGYVPTQQKAKAAYDNTRQALIVLKTPMFEYKFLQQSNA